MRGTRHAGTFVTRDFREEVAQRGTGAPVHALTSATVRRSLRFGAQRQVAIEPRLHH